VKEIFKKFYRAIPFKKQFYSLLKLLWLPPHSVYKHLHFEDTFSVVTENRTFKIRHYGYEVENGLFWRGVEQCWEGTSLGLWKELCKESRIILDIGANTGVYSLIAQTINPNAKVYAFEPLKQVCEKLRSNCQLNGYDIACLEVAVSNYDGKAKVYLSSMEHVYSVTVNENRLDSDREVFEQEVRTVKLSTFIEQNQIGNIDLMKIDVEYHEVKVLEGMEGYLDKMRPSMIIEVLNDEVGRGIEDILKGGNYLFFDVSESGTIRPVEHITKGNGYNYLVCNDIVARKLHLHRS
jgi:FkbM family methyltransferase